MSVSIFWTRSNVALIGSVQGRIDSQSANVFHGLIKEAIEPDAHNLVLDFTRLSFISSAGLRILLIMAREYKSMNKFMGLCCLSESVRDVMRISGFDQIVTIHTSREASLQAAQGKDPDEITEAPREAGDITFTGAFDMAIIQDRISDMAAYAVEKHENITRETLPVEVKEQAITEIEEELRRVSQEIGEKLRNCRKMLFNMADECLRKVMES